MSAVYYNGISLAYVKTTRYENRSIASPENPDQMWREGTLEVEAIIAPGITPDQGGESLVALANRIQHALELPRRPFRYEFAGEVVIDMMGGQDDFAGPFPHGVSVKLVADASLVVTFGVTYRSADCYYGHRPSVLSLRWRESATINENWLTTKRRNGRLVISSRQNLSADSFRGLVVPKIDPGFVRTESVYTLHENGLELEFQFTDEQRTALPPWPAIVAKGTQAETSTYPGAVRFGQIDLRLEGPPGVEKKELLKQAVRLATSRIMDTAVTGQNGSVLHWGGIKEDLFANAIELSVRWQMKAIKKVVELRGGPGGGPFPVPPVGGGQANRPGTPTLSMSVPWLGKELPGTSPFEEGLAPPIRGTCDFLGLVAAVFQDVCLRNTIVAEMRNTGQNSEVDTNQRSKVRIAKPSYFESELAEYEDPTPGVYADYQITLHYNHDEGMEVAPAMKTGEPGKAFRLSGESMELIAEWTAKRTNGLPVIPSKQSNDTNAIYVGGTISPAEVQLSGDGTSTVYTISGVYRFKFLNPCKVNIVAPVPPFLAKSVSDEARLIAAFTSNSIIFLPPEGGRPGQPPPTPINPFCGHTTELVSGGGFPFGGGGGGFTGELTGGRYPFS